MKKEDAIALVKRAIFWCHLRDLPETKASMTDLLATLDVVEPKHFTGDPKRRLLH